MSTDFKGPVPGAPAKPSIEDLAARGGIASEHVILAGDYAHEAPTGRSSNLKQRFGYQNRLRGTEIQFALYDDGLLDITEKRKNVLVYRQSIDLRYLQAKPKLSRYVTKITLRMTLICAAIAIVAGTLAYLSVLPSFFVAVASISAATTVIALIVTLYRKRERAVFYTQHGHAGVVTLTANIGCVRRFRRELARLTEAIGEARKHRPADWEAHLRAEMREHYRLAAAGHLSEVACATATQRILDQFDTRVAPNGARPR